MVKTNAVISAPRNKEPVSPINILAGLILKIRNPADAPISEEQTKASSDESFIGGIYGKYTEDEFKSE